MIQLATNSIHRVIAISTRGSSKLDFFFSNFLLLFNILMFSSIFLP